MANPSGASLTRGGHSSLAHPFSRIAAVLALIGLIAGCGGPKAMSLVDPAWPLRMSDSRLAPIMPPGAAGTGALLTVITFGNGCPGDGGGNGLRELADAIRARHPEQQVITRGCDDQDDIGRTIETHRGPVALVGHSFGGCRSIEIAGRLRRQVDWMVLLDPVPCDAWAFRHAGHYFELSANVREAICFYRPAGLWPISYPILRPASASDNRLRRLGHGDFCADAEVRECILNLCDGKAAVKVLAQK